MMRLPVASLIAAAILSIPTANAEAQSCPEFVVAQKSFRELTKNAYVWVDDIESRFPTGYKPFELVVVVGGAYPPFGTREGKLERAAFERLMKTARLAARQPLRVSPEAVARGLEMAFQSGQTRYRLRVVKVSPVYMGVDKVTVQLCQG